MGMFDEVKAMNICHKNFNRQHNGHVFQTKSLDCDMSEYCIFNGVLYQEVDKSGENKHHDYAIEVGYSGELNIYTHIEEYGVTCWVEYDLVFDSGKLIDVVAYEVRVTEDKRDLSARRPAKPSNRVEVTISVGNCDRETQGNFAARFDNQMLDAIRDIIGDSKATIFYPVIRSSEERFGVYPRLLTIASVVQTMEDVEAAANGTTIVTAPNGDRIHLIMDEYSAYKF